MSLMLVPRDDKISGLQSKKLFENRLGISQDLVCNLAETRIAEVTSAVLSLKSRAKGA